MKALLDRLKEPSSWSGLGLVLGMFGLNVDPGFIQTLSVTLAGGAGVASFFVKEKSNR